MMINVFFVNHGYSGADTYQDELLKGLSSQTNIDLYKLYFNYDTDELTIKRDSETDNAIKVLFPKSIYRDRRLENYYKWNCFLLKSLTHKNDKNIFQLNKETDYMLIRWAKYVLNAKVIFTVHYLAINCSYMELISDYSDSRYINARLGLCLNESDHIICVTKFAKKVITKLGIVEENKCSVVYNGYSDANSCRYNKKQLREELGFLPDDKLILYPRTINEEKGIYELIRAVKRIVKLKPELKLILIIAGQGNFGKVLKMSYGIRNNIVCTGQLEKEELEKFYIISDIGIIPSKVEQCSYVALEMMKFKLPIIASNAPGFDELFTTNSALKIKLLPDHDRKLPILDEEDLFNKIFTLLDNDILQKHIANNSYELWNKNYMRCVMVNKTCDVYFKQIEND